MLSGMMRTFSFSSYILVLYIMVLTFLYFYLSKHPKCLFSELLLFPPPPLSIITIIGDCGSGEQRWSTYLKVSSLILALLPPYQRTLWQDTKLPTAPDAVLSAYECVSD